MKISTRIARAALVAVAMIGLATQIARTQPARPEVVRLSLTGVVDPFMADYLRSQIEAAADDGAGAVLIEIDTPGGLVSSTREITQAILGAQVPVITYVSPTGARAASAGAFVLLAGNVAAMAPATNVGASTPVGVSGVVLTEKVTNDAAASIVAIAEERGRNADVAEDFVRDALSISADQALDDDVIDLIASTDAELLQEVDGTEVTLGDGTTATLHTAGAPIRDVSMSPGLGFLHALFDPNLAFIFFWLGIALIVLELIVPGHIFSGTVGTILLIIAIVSFGFLPVRLVGILLLIGAAVAFVLEINAPGLGVWSLVGLGCLIAGGALLYQPSGGVRVSPWVIVPVAVVIALFFGFVVQKAMRLRRMPPAQGPEAIVGREGVVVGRGIEAGGGIVRVDAEEWRAVSPAAPLAPETPIRVTSLDGLVLTVEPAASEHVPAGGGPPTSEGGSS